MTTAISPGVYMQTRRKAILCLCDDNAMLQVRRMLLEHVGYTVLPTSSVEDAKSLVLNECPDMLLMDNGSPGIEQLAKQVKTICPNVITVVLSPYFGVRHDTEGAGIDRFVPKDDGPGVWISQIEELFDKRTSDGDKEVAGL